MILFGAVLPLQDLDEVNAQAPSSSQKTESQPPGSEKNSRGTQPKQSPLDPVLKDQKQQADETSRTPIYTYKSKKAADNSSPNTSDNGVGNQSRERLVRPGTPYTEIDESKVGLSKKVMLICNHHCWHKMSKLFNISDDVAMLICIVYLWD